MRLLIVCILALHANFATAYEMRVSCLFDGTEVYDCEPDEEQIADDEAGKAENQAETDYFKLYPEDRKFMEVK